LRVDDTSQIYGKFKENYASIDLGVAIVSFKRKWHAIFVKATLSYKKPYRFFNSVVRTPKFRILRGSFPSSEFETLLRILSQGGQLNVPITSRLTIGVLFREWKRCSVSFEQGRYIKDQYGIEYPSHIVRFESDWAAWRELEREVNFLLQCNDVPYADYAESISQNLSFKKDRLEIDRDGKPRGYLLIPIYARIFDCRYGLEGGQFSLDIITEFYHKIPFGKLALSSRIEMRDGTRIYIRKQRLQKLDIQRTREMCIARKTLKARTDPSETSWIVINLVLDNREPILLDKMMERELKVLLPETKISQIMREYEFKGREQTEYLEKTWKKLMEGKGHEFEDAVFTMLTRLGFDAVLEARQKNHLYDILACSPQGVLIVECTSDRISKVMAEKIYSTASEIQKQLKVRAIPLIFTNQINSNELDANVQDFCRRSRVLIVTRDRISTIIEIALEQRPARTFLFWQFFYEKCTSWP